VKGQEMGRSHRLAGTVCAACWMLFAITLVILLTAGDGGYLGYQMLRHAPPEASRLPAEEYPGMGNMVAGYLTGRTERFQYEYPGASGEPVVCFHDYEEAHMADCRELIRLDRLAMQLSSALLLVLTAACAPRRPTEFRRGMLRGLRILLAAAAVLAVWAVTDFDGFFVTFHKVAFTNDGWLLNPRTDMLIRLMPEEFFISLGVRGAPWVLGALALLWIAARWPDAGKWVRPGSFGKERNSGSTENHDV